MVNNIFTRKDLISQLNILSNKVIPYLKDSIQSHRIDELKKDIEDDFYTVVVLGEFKRGKSTFINALIGEDLLPVDVTPTTATINILNWNEDRELSIHMRDGSVEDMSLTRQSLIKYVAGADFDVQAVNYLNLRLPVDILKNRVMLIDTPGVDDLNEQRVEVTYNFIPKADVVVFLLDATSPVRRTEKEFLQDTILKEGTDQIVFVANFFDYVEEDEQEDIIDEIQRRVKSAIGKKSPVYPLSAREALEGKLENDKKTLEESGILKIENEIVKLIENGNREQQKIKQFKNRLDHICYDVEQEVSSLLNIHRASIEQLDNELKQIHIYVDKKAKRRMILEEYTRDREREMIAIVRKSIYSFGESLRDQVQLELDNFTGLDIKGFAEKQLPIKVQREIKRWYEQYSPAIHKMLEKYEKALVIGLAKEFDTAVTRLGNQQNYIDSFYLDVQNHGIHSDDISNTPIVAGVITGGATLATILVGLPILFPIIGMAGFPMIQKMLVEKRLQQAKDKIIPMLNYALDDIILKLREFIEDMVISSIKDIQNAAIKRFDDQIKYIQEKVQEEIQKRKADSKEESIKIEKLNEAQRTIDDLLNNKYIENSREGVI